MKATYLDSHGARFSASSVMDTSLERPNIKNLPVVQPISKPRIVWHPVECEELKEQLPRECWRMALLDPGVSPWVHPSIASLAHIVSADGIIMDPSNVEAIPNGRTYYGDGRRVLRKFESGEFVSAPDIDSSISSKKLKMDDGEILWAIVQNRRRKHTEFSDDDDGVDVLLKICYLLS
ncbi:hypothetical protein Tco_0700288 [Tanacetum coccineum]